MKALALKGRGLGVVLMMLCFIFSTCDSNVFEELPESQPQTNVSKKGSMYEYLYAEVKNVNFAKHPSESLRVYPFAGTGEITQIPQLEATILYRVPDPDSSRMTVVLKVYDRNDVMDFPINSFDGRIVPGRIYMPCSFAFAFFESDYPSVESFNVDWYSAKVVCYDDLEFFKKYQKDIKKHSLSD